MTITKWPKTDLRFRQSSSPPPSFHSSPRGSSCCHPVRLGLSIVAHLMSPLWQNQMSFEGCQLKNIPSLRSGLQGLWCLDALVSSLRALVGSPSVWSGSGLHRCWRPALHNWPLAQDTGGWRALWPTENGGGTCCRQLGPRHWMPHFDAVIFAYNYGWLKS